MITPLLQLALDPVVARRRQVRLMWQLALCWALFAALASMQVLSAPVLALLAGVVALGVWKLNARWQPDYRAIARLIEQRHPELHALLVTAVEQQPDAKSGRLHFLQQRVVQEAIDESRRHTWIDAVPATRRAGAIALQFLLLGTFAFSLARLQWTRSPHIQAAPLVADEIIVTPGDAAVERGSGLVVLATFGRAVPSEAVLVVLPANQPPQRIPLVKNLDDPVFGGGLPEVDDALTYRVEYAGQATRDFRVTVFEHPRLERADAHLTFPDYTGLPAKDVPDTRRVSAVEGSKLSVDFQLNKPVRAAKLVAKDKTEVVLEVDPDKPRASLREFPLSAGETYQLQMEDADGRTNKLSAQLVVDVRPNRRPELKFTAPRGDQSVTALQEVSFKGEAWDDFGMPAYGLHYTVAGQPPVELTLGRDGRADEKLTIEHMLKLEELNVSADQLVSWYLWAEDIGPDGKSRRTESDIFFAEVRPFEEIFRAGQSGEGQQQQGGAAGGAAQKQASDQKQIIIATWNLRRAEEARGGAQLSEKYLKDELAIREAQDAALKEATATQAKLEDPRSQGLMDQATAAMQTALDRLDEAASSTVPLPDAITAEQAAYNALLKLAAHEFEVSRSQSSSGQPQNAARQGQLDQLEMKEEQNRYETKREAQPAQNEQQREQLAVLNRLKELAQRQGDINQRVKELQTALQAAKTEQEREELQRQLKRLREEEQQLLADLDEARQKMESGANAAQTADERKQLEQTRGEAQQAAEALQKNLPAQALAAGTRAERELQKLRDDFRKKTSGQFSDALREMRNDARELAQKQQELGEKLAEPPAPAQRTLAETNPRAELEQKFADQQKGLGSLREQMREVSEQAEGVEPLLAKELYETLRKNTQAATDQTLERAGQLATRGFAPQAKKFEEKARQEIEELKTGVERAAESVLGNEAEALRTARAELETLRAQLDRELAQARPDLAANTPGNERSPTEASETSGAGKPGPSAEQGEAPGGTDESQGAQPGAGEPRKQAAAGKEGNQPMPRNGERSGHPRTPGETSIPSDFPGEPQSGDERGAGQGQSKDSAESQPGGQQPGGQQPGGQQPGGQQPGGQQPGGQQPGGQQPGGQQPGGQQPGGSRAREMGETHRRRGVRGQQTAPALGCGNLRSSRGNGAELRAAAKAEGARRAAELR